MFKNFFLAQKIHNRLPKEGLPSFGRGTPVLIQRAAGTGSSACMQAKRKGGIPFSQQMLKFRQRFFSSSVVERSAVNRLVVGSNPTWGDFIILVPSGI